MSAETVSRDAVQGITPDAGSDEIHVRWVVPESCIEAPLNEDRSLTVNRLDALAHEYLPGMDPAERLNLVNACVDGFEALASVGIEYTAFCMADIDGTVCVATLYAALYSGDDTPAGKDVTVASLANTLDLLEIGEVSEIQLPVAPAVSCIGARESEAELRDLIGDESVTSWFIQLHLPLPNDAVLLMEMNTPTTAGWETFSVMFANIVRSIRLYNPDGSLLLLPGRAKS